MGVAWQREATSLQGQALTRTLARAHATDDSATIILNRACMSRTHTFTPERASRFLTALIEAKGFIEVACGAARIPRSTVYGWFARGDQGEEPFAEFLLDVHEVRSGQVTRHLKNQERIADNSDGPQSVMASQWAAERLMPGLFGVKAQVEQAVTERLQQTLDGVQPLMPADSYRDLLHALAALAGNGRVVSEEASAGASAVVDVSGEVVGETRTLSASTEPDQSAG